MSYKIYCEATVNASSVVMHLWWNIIPLYNINEVKETLFTFGLCISRELCCGAGAFPRRPIENTVKERPHKFLDECQLKCEK